MTADDQGIERAITDAMMRRHQADGLRRQLEEARTQAQESSARAEAAAVAAQSEQRDVDKLEDLSWASVWAKARGRHDTDLAREKAEADAARYTAATEQRRAEAAAAAVRDLEQRLAALGDVDAAYVAALADKERWITEHPDLNGPAAARIADIAAELGTLAAREREVEEARRAGTEAERLLAAAAGLLDSAAGWATWDVMGGGMLTDMAKHNKMNEAQYQLEDADRALKAFNRELADVSDVAGGTTDGLKMDGFSYTFDVWFDNIFSDMAVSRRINDTRDRLGATRKQLQVLRNRLRVEAGQIEERRTALAAERESVLTR